MTEYFFLLFSTISYLKIKNYENIDFEKSYYTVESLFNDKTTFKKDKKTKFLKDKITPIKDFRLINYAETSSGLGCYCFKSPTNNLIFAFRGTEILDIRDLWADFKIMIGKNPKKIKQFNDALEFVKETTKFDTNHSQKIYFTGHSLGGGLAQYCAYINSKIYKVQSVTFNGVGIFQNLTSPLFVPDDNVLVDYSFMNDLVGNFGEEIGIQKFVNSTKKILKDFSNHGILNFYNYVFLNSYKLNGVRENEEIYLFYHIL